MIIICTLLLRFVMNSRCDSAGVATLSNKVLHSYIGLIESIIVQDKTKELRGIGFQLRQ